MPSIFVLQDLTRRHDQFGDGVAYTKYRARRLLGRRGRRSDDRDPSGGLHALWLRTWWRGRGLRR
ncbi:hypothetical protein ACFYSF_30665 [Streptomyces canus]|uniref:hypothetical protein n=1 Tax=Streptomyces canus TaxID=58343 RepID=UPI0036A4B7C3